MDFSSILTTLWGKISKPLPNILVGLVFVFLAPEFIRWAGFIFIAIGISSSCEWAFPRIKEWAKKKALIKKINSLSKEEISLLNNVRLNERLSFNSHKINPDDLKKQQTLLKLEAKKLVESNKWENFGGSGFSFYLPYEVKLALRDIVDQAIQSLPPEENS